MDKPDIGQVGGLDSGRNPYDDLAIALGVYRSIAGSVISFPPLHAPNLR
jgi:hypothetical protein